MLLWKEGGDEGITISTSDTSPSIITDLPVHPREFNIPIQQAHAFENILFQNTKNHNPYTLTTISFLGVIALFLFFSRQ